MKTCPYNTSCKILLFFLLFLFSDSIKAQRVIRISNDNYTLRLSKAGSYWIDDKGNTAPDEVLQQKFIESNGNIPVFKSSVENVWLKFRVANQRKNSTILLDVQYTNLSRIIVYEVQPDRTIIPLQQQGNEVKYKSVVPYSSNYTFRLPVPLNEERTFLVNVKSEHPIIFPANVGIFAVVQRDAMIQSLIIGFYFGVLVIMLFYNFFLYLSTYDRNYLLYVFYLAALGLAQLAASGYGYKFIWQSFPELNRMAVPLTTALSAITGIFFTIEFLNTKTNFRKAHNLLLIFVGIYLVGLAIAPFTKLHYAYDVVNFVSLVAAVTIVMLCVSLMRQGYRPAKLYLLGWSFMLVSLILVVLRNLSVLPYNTFTAYILYTGSVLEVALLSFALADKINIYKKEKEASQQQALLALQENERIVREQNIVLEQKVAERTEELSVALHELKDAQTQLVESEKMASLGQLTAGIAHEINNPINFVQSNVKPIRMDVEDLLRIIDEYGQLHNLDEGAMSKKLQEVAMLKKELDVDFLRSEVDELLNGIEDGASRTAEIVRGLRTFSRVDESEIKTIDVHEGLDSTLIILKSNIPKYIQLKKQYNANPMIECFPGKLNQVFMNILSNAIQAITDQPQHGEEEIVVSTGDDGPDRIWVSIKDSGPGMSADVKQKIFDPFFTTKDVGQGTGLGLAIVFKIIQKHEGSIKVNSEEGKGAEFLINLPRKLSNY